MDESFFNGESFETGWFGLIWMYIEVSVKVFLPLVYSLALL